MEQDLPRLLLVSEVSLSQNGTGIDRTLFNLLDHYPMDRFMLYTLGHSDTFSPFDGNVAIFKESYVPLVSNRLGCVCNPLLQTFNLQLIDWLPPSDYRKIAEFAPEVVLICPNSPSALVVGHKITQQLSCPFLIYFMDDWVYNNHIQWLSGGVQHYSQALLSHASGWLMISNQLEKELINRYGLSPKRSLIVHNPINVSSLSPPDFTLHEGTFKVVYAGSIWPMHYDAVAAIAEAIFELRQEGYDIELILHTPQTFWDQYQQFWESWQVTYGSMIPYNDLQTYLKRSDLLLVASSFNPEYTHITRSSVQTKLFDYVVSGRPILSCGSSYSACNAFVTQWNCGTICETNCITEIKHCLKEQVNNQDIYLSITRTAFEVVKDHFNKDSIQSKLYAFIQETRDIHQ